MKSIEKTGKTVDEAIVTALTELHLNKEDVDIEVITKGSKGILGFGAKNAKIKVTYEQDNQEEIIKEASKEEINEEMIEPIEQVTFKQDDESIQSLVSDTNSDTNQVEVVSQKASDFLTRLLKQMCIKGNVKIVKIDESAMTICLEGENMGILIGRRGETLDSIQYLVNIVANKGRQQYIKILVDTENYRAKRAKTLETLAIEMSKRVKKTHKPIMLESMNPYDRRIIHAILQEDPYVRTYSEGKDPFRKVVIVPNNL